MDLNADVGEERGDDAALVRIATSVSVASGAHAGGGDVLARTVAQAVQAGCRVGAHPSYRDRENFGRISRSTEVSTGELSSDIAEQILLVAAQCTANGAPLSHVKVHGALYNDAAVDPGIAWAVVEGAAQAALSIGVGALPVLGMPSSVLHRLATDAGAPFIREGFADRRYASASTLTPRGTAGAVLADPDEACRQAIRLAGQGEVILRDGTVARVPVDTLCVHGDSPGAVALALAVRSGLEARGIVVAGIDTWST
jgi:UPF0271 protein